MVKKQLEDMNLIDNFLIQAISSDQEVNEASLRCILEVLLERKIGKIRVVSEKIVPGYSPEHRGIRMDVEITEMDANESKTVTNVFDMEPHTGKERDFPRANRFRQAKIDSRYMKSGDNDFIHLPDLYVITITNYDIFGEGQMIYTFREKCVEVPDLPYENGLYHIYFNTTGTKGGSKSIKNMLHFMENSNSTAVVDEATKELDGYVRKVKMDPEVRRELMTFGDIIDRERDEAKIEDRVESIIDLLCELGEVSPELEARINAQNNMDSLKKLLRLAAHADSIKEFEEQMNEVLKDSMIPV
ncbi:MAG: hypothetical protein J6O73_05490 [Lachnospiraceae bacterium]|nr:hypothetical protein [Lachnospiraceae bacterium]